MPTDRYIEEQKLLNSVAWAPSKRGHFRKIRYKYCQWLTTAPNPIHPAHTHSADDGQVGWKLHMVIAHPDNHKKYSHPKALCGCKPRHGWGVDLFIDEPCMRCIKQAIKRKITLPEVP